MTCINNQIIIGFDFIYSCNKIKEIKKQLKRNKKIEKNCQLKMIITDYNRSSLISRFHHSMTFLLV